MVRKCRSGFTSWLAKSEDEVPVSGLAPNMYLLTVSAISDGFSVVAGPVAPKSPSQIVDTETSISAGFSISGSCRVSISGRTPTSGIVVELLPPLVCDLRTMKVVSSKRLMSPEWVTMGVGPDSRVASMKADLLGRVLRPEVSVGAVSVIFLDISTTTESTKSSYLYSDYW